MGCPTGGHRSRNVERPRPLRAWCPPARTAIQAIQAIQVAGVATSRQPQDNRVRPRADRGCVMGGVHTTRRLRVHQASTRDGPSRFVPQCGRPVSPSGHNRGCVVVDGSFERFTSPSTATNPHPPPQQSPERPNPTPRRKRVSAADPTLRVPFLPSAWAKPQPQVSRGIRRRIRLRRPAELEAIRILPTELEAERVLLDACGYLWQVDGRKGTRNPPPPGGQPSGEDHPSTEAVQRGHPSN
jgi:hypothetical protein